MKTNKTTKWLLAVGFVAVIAGCDSSGSGESGSNDGSAAGLDMLDLTMVDQEALAEQVHNELTEPARNCGAVLFRGGVTKISAKKYKETLESGPCIYGGSINVIENVEYNKPEKSGHSLEVSYDQCKKYSADGYPINGYEKDYMVVTTESGIIAGRTTLVYKDGRYGMEDYICTGDGFKGESLEVTTGTHPTSGYEYYKYSVETKVTKWGNNNSGHSNYLELAYEILYNINGYRSMQGGFVHIKADAIIETGGHTGCRTDGVVHLTGKNNSKVTIQYNADRSMDFTLNGKTEHWYSCMQKNP